jgi:serine/threonine protein kinase
MATDSIGGLARGTMLHSRYRLERLLGIGGMASVWLARDEQLDRGVAVKIIADALAADPVWVRRFEREARAAASLSHPNIVRVFDFGAEQGRPFLVMEYVPGGTLADLLERGGRVRAEHLARHLLDAVRHIHAAGLLHRDIKPANVLLASDHTPQLTDFGIAHHSDATRLTSTGNVVGTVRYLAPEVLAGKPASARSDLFACGRLLGDVLSAARNESRLAGLVQALTAEDPALRPPSAAEALELLDQASTAETRAPETPAPVSSVAETRVAETPLAETRVLEARETVALRRGQHPSAPARVPRRSLRTALAGLTALLLVVVLVIVLVLVSGSGRPAGHAGAPQPAAASAPLSSQLDALSRRVRYAARR